MYWKIGDKFQMLSIFVSNFAFRHKPCDAPLYFCVIFYSLQKNVLSEMNIVIFGVVFQLYFSFKTKILEFCSPTQPSPILSNVGF